MEYSPNPRVISFDLGVPSGRKRSFASQVFARGKCNWNLEECINRLWSRDPCLIVPVVASRVTILQENMDHEYFARFCTFLFNRFVLSKYNNSSTHRIIHHYMPQVQRRQARRQQVIALMRLGPCTPSNFRPFKVDRTSTCMSFDFFLPHSCSYDGSKRRPRGGFPSHTMIVVNGVPLIILYLAQKKIKICL